MDKQKQIEEMAKDIYNATVDCKWNSCSKCEFDSIPRDFCKSKHIAKTMVEKHQPKLSKDSVVLSREELKRLETNYKIGLGKSQSWCKSLKNRIEELEKENFKLKVDNEVLKEEKEQFENDVCNYEMNLQHLTGELENKSKETAEKFYKFAKAWFEDDEQNDYFEEVKNLAKQFGVEIKE